MKILKYTKSFFMLLLVLPVILSGCKTEAVTADRPLPLPQTEAPDIQPKSAAQPTTAATEPTETEPAETEPSQTETKETEPKETEPKETEPSVIKLVKAELAQGNRLLEGVVIGIDAGHQLKGNNEKELASPGSDEKKAKVSSGTAGIKTRIAEYQVNLDVALLLQKRLEAQGATVIMVRTTNDVDVSNQQRATMMNDSNVDLCIRIHCNGSDNSKAKGAMMLIPEGNVTWDINQASRDYGEIILRHYINSTQAKDLGLVYRSDLTGFNWSTVPVCLIEMGFMSNPEEDLLLADADYQEKCAKGLADGIVECFTK